MLRELQLVVDDRAWLAADLGPDAPAPCGWWSDNSPAAAVLTEGLRQAGRRLGRSELLAGLESLYRFETGLTPPLTYTPNRRVGANGAWVVITGGDRGDGLALLETAQWVDLP